MVVSRGVVDQAFRLSTVVPIAVMHRRAPRREIGGCHMAMTITESKKARGVDRERRLACSATRAILWSSRGVLLLDDEDELA